MRTPMTLALVALAALGPAVAAAAGPALDPVVVRDPRWAADDPHYYLKVEFVEPELPRDGDAKDDCAAGARPVGLVRSAFAVLAPVASNPPHPDTFNGLSPYTPTCLAIDTGYGVYASWNVASGYWYLDPGSGIALPVGPPTESSASGATAGRLPVGITADCADCPPIM